MGTEEEKQDFAKFLQKQLFHSVRMIRYTYDTDVDDDFTRKSDQIIFVIKPLNLIRLNVHKTKSTQPQ